MLKSNYYIKIFRNKKLDKVTIVVSNLGGNINGFKAIRIRSSRLAEPGVSFKDITTIMDNGEAYGYATDKIVEYAKDRDVDIVVGPEARGFMIGCPVAYSMGIGFAPVEKKGELPREVIRYEYDLEYGTNVLTMHKDAIKTRSTCVNYR